MTRSSRLYGSSRTIRRCSGADFKGDLRASIMAELDANPDAVPSESELALGVRLTCAAIIDSVEKLELSGRVNRQRKQNRLTVQPIRR